MLCTAECASHTRLHQYPMAMRFHIWPIKFSFDWPFRPSNKLLLYCTLDTIKYVHYNEATYCESGYVSFRIDIGDAIQPIFNLEVGTLYAALYEGEWDRAKVITNQVKPE